jgi:hypothetical protein
MAYSRFGKHSAWYTFWTASFSEDTRYKLPTNRLKRNQYFEICDMTDPYYVSYGQLKDRGIKAVVKEIQEKYKGRKIKFWEYTRLRWYLIQFMSDVDEHFEWKNFLLYEWWYQIRNLFYYRIKSIGRKKRHARLVKAKKLYDERMAKK